MSDKRKTRLTPKEWAEATALWESGEVTSKDLADKFGVSRETFLRRFKKDGIEKGVRAHEHADAVREELSKSLNPEHALTAQRAKETKEQHYNWSAALARMAMNEIAVAARDKHPVASKLPNLKAIEKAAAILEKTRNERWIVLGLDKNDDFDDELPELAINEMTADEIIAIQRQSMDDSLGMGEDDDDDIVSLDDEDDVVVGFDE